MRRVVIVGASQAGLNAANELREHGYDGEVVLVGAEREPPYDRPPLSKEALREGSPADDLHLRPGQWYAERGVRLRLGQAAVELDPTLRSVTLDDGTQLPYEGLIIATGAAPVLPAGWERHPRVHVLRTAADSARLHRRLRRGGHLVVVGAGFIGLEVAATARAMGAEVTVVEMATAPLSRALGEEAGSWLRDLHARHGVQMRCGTAVLELAGTGDGVLVVLAGGETLAADDVLVAVGVRPSIDWLAGSGLELGDGVLCDERCRCSVADVVAAGDVARWYNPLFDEQMRVEHWMNAVEQGRAAARSLLGDPAPYAPVPYFWSDQFDARLRFVGEAYAADDVEVRPLLGPGDPFVVLYGRDKVLRGALLVNAMRAVARYRLLVASQAPWREVTCAPAAV